MFSQEPDCLISERTDRGWLTTPRRARTDAGMHARKYMYGNTGYRIKIGKDLAKHLYKRFPGTRLRDMRKKHFLWLAEYVRDHVDPEDQPACRAFLARQLLIHKPYKTRPDGTTLAEQWFRPGTDTLAKLSIYLNETRVQRHGESAALLAEADVDRIAPCTEDVTEEDMQAEDDFYDS